MSFYRKLFVGCAVAAFTLPVLANDNANNNNPSSQNYQQSQQMANTIELTENGVKTTDANAQATDAGKQDASAAMETKVNLNKATVADLMKVKGLNAAKAKAIVSYRNKHGDFKSMDDLKQVKGFKKMKDAEWKIITDQLEM